MNDNSKRLIVAVILVVLVVGVLSYKEPAPAPTQSTPTVDEIIAANARKSRKEIEAMENKAKEYDEKAKELEERAKKSKK